MSPKGSKEKIAWVFLHSRYAFQCHTCSRGLFSDDDPLVYFWHAWTHSPISRVSTLVFFSKFNDALLNGSTGLKGRGFFVGVPLLLWNGFSVLGCHVIHACTYKLLASLLRADKLFPSHLTQEEETRRSHASMDGTRGRGCRWEGWLLISEDMRTKI